MKTLQSPRPLQLALWTLLVLSGCVYPGSTASPIPEASMVTAFPSLITTSTAIPSTPKPMPFDAPTLITIPTVPILIPEQEQRMQDSLQSSDCTLPCYLGIVPGQTTLQDAITILEKLGGHYSPPLGRSGAYQRETDGAFSYTYQFHIGDPSTGKKIVYGSISLTTDNELVQVIENAGAGTSLPELEQKASEIYRQYWHRYYSAKQIFLQLGEPDQIYTFDNQSDTLILFYKDPAIRIDIVGTTQENNLCPRDRTEYSLSVYMSISSINSPYSIEGDGKVPLTDREVYLPIEETFGVTPRQFYEQVLRDPTVCFEPKVSNP